VRLPTAVRRLRRARSRRLGLVPLLVSASALVGVGGGGVAVSQPSGAPSIAGPSGAVNSPPSYTITGDAGAQIQWSLCQEASPVCVVGAGDTQTSTGPVPSGAASTADGVYLLTATQTLANVQSAPAIVSFRLDRAPPPVPTGVRTTGAGGAAGPSFAWTPGEPGGTFRWELRRPGVIGPAVLTGSEAAGSTTIVKPLADGAYAFRVRQVDDAGNAGPWSASVAITVGAVPPPVAVNPPEITSAAPAPGNASPTFTWRTGAAPGTHSLSWRVITGQTVVVGPTTTSDTHATLPAPLAPGAYTFRVVELDPSGVASAAAKMDFTISEAPAPPPITGLILTPGVGQIGLVWSLAATPDVDAIRLIRRSDASPEGPLDPAATLVDLPADARAYVDLGLAGGTTYHYALYARSLAGAFSAVAATGSATAQALPPPVVTPPPVLNSPPVPPPPAGPSATAQSVMKPIKATAVLPKPKPKPAARPTAGGTIILNAKRLRPGPGVSVRFLQPQLRWNDRSRGVMLYNLQIFDAKGRKLHKAFPLGRRYIVPPNILHPGHRYFWRVWPWYGPVKKFSPAPLGVSFFQVKGPIIPQ
jgi:hypothetical protein